MSKLYKPNLKLKDKLLNGTWGLFDDMVAFTILGDTVIFEDGSMGKVEELLNYYDFKGGRIMYLTKFAFVFDDVKKAYKEDDSDKPPIFDRRKTPVEKPEDEEPTSKDSKDGITEVIEMLDAFCELGETLMKIEETCKKRGMTDKESEGYMGALINQAIKETIDEIKAENAEKKIEKERG